MNPHIAPQTITELALADGTRVLLSWDCPNHYDDSGSANISVGGLYTGEVQYWGADAIAPTHQYMATRYSTDSAQPGGWDAPQTYYLQTNDLLEAVAFAVAGPAGWTPNLHAQVARSYWSAADLSR